LAFIVFIPLGTLKLLLHFSTMDDNQSKHSSTVAPSESVSAAGRGKSKPGKAERAARRSAVGSQQGQAASAAKAAVFSSGAVVAKPQPGKFPVVFQTGAGEPSRDVTFAIDNRVLLSTLSSLPTRYTYNAKYAEFKAHAEIDDQVFAKDLIVSSLLRLAQQVVHSHVNLGLPQGDFAPLASTDVRVPAAVSAYLSQYGEYAVPSLGTRYLLRGYEDTLASIVWCADRVNANGNLGAPLQRMWLPTRRSDDNTKAVIAARLREFLSLAHLSVDPNVLEEGVLSGSLPDEWGIVKLALGGDDATRDRFDFLFGSYADVGQFTTAFTTAEASAVLTELGLSWPAPSAGDLDWSFNVKRAFTRLSDLWARKSATYALFFELSSSVMTRPSAVGSPSQMASVSTMDSVTVLKTHLALSAPEFSLVACFPVTGLFSGGVVRNVVMTTPLSVLQRGTEFVQMDWR
jgi:hypothetical protein